MPRIERTVHVNVGLDEAFAVSQTTGALRLSWDPFIREQHLLDNARRPGKGVRTSTTSRHRLRMVSQYTAFRPPFTIRPSWLARFADPIGRWLLGRDIEARIRAYASACDDRRIVAAALEQANLADPT